MGADNIEETDYKIRGISLALRFAKGTKTAS